MYLSSFSCLIKYAKTWREKKFLCSQTKPQLHIGARTHTHKWRRPFDINSDMQTSTSSPFLTLRSELVRILPLYSQTNWVCVCVQKPKRERGHSVQRSDDWAADTGKKEADRRRNKERWLTSQLSVSHCFGSHPNTCTHTHSNTEGVTLLVTAYMLPEQSLCLCTTFNLWTSLTPFNPARHKDAHKDTGWGDRGQSCLYSFNLWALPPYLSMPPFPFCLSQEDHSSLYTLSLFMTLTWLCKGHVTVTSLCHHPWVTVSLTLTCYTSVERHSQLTERWFWSMCLIELSQLSA